MMVALLRVTRDDEPDFEHLLNFDIESQESSKECLVEALRDYLSDVEDTAIDDLDDALALYGANWIVPVLSVLSILKESNDIEEFRVIAFDARGKAIGM